MPDANVSPPFAAYMGNDSFVFVSYAHKDAEAVFPELKRLHDELYRIWYDEGIDPGNEWPDAVANALSRASLFLVFISANAVSSQNVRNEVNFALNNKKPFVAVHLAETILPAGLELRMGDIQAVMKYRMTEENYCRKMDKALPARLRTPREEHRIQEAISAIQTVLAKGERWCLGAIDLSVSSDKARLEARIMGEVYPGFVYDLRGHGWEMDGGSGWNDPPQGCRRCWLVEGATKEVRTIALNIIWANDLQGYLWRVQPNTSPVPK